MLEQQHQPVERETSEVLTHVSQNVLSHVLSETCEENGPASCYSLASALVKKTVGCRHAQGQSPFFFSN